MGRGLQPARAPRPPNHRPRNRKAPQRGVVFARTPLNRPGPKQRSRRIDRGAPTTDR